MKQVRLKIYTEDRIDRGRKEEGKGERTEDGREKGGWNREKEGRKEKAKRLMASWYRFQNLEWIAC